MPVIRKKLSQKTSIIGLTMSFDPWRKRRIDIYLRRNELNTTAGSVLSSRKRFLAHSICASLEKKKLTCYMKQKVSTRLHFEEKRPSIHEEKGTCFWPKLNQNFNNVAKFPFLFPKESLFKILCFAVKAEVHPEQQNTLQNTCSLLLEHFWLNAGEQTELIEHLPYFRYWAVRENHHWLHLQHPFAFPQSLFKPFGTKCLMDQLAWRTSVSVGV